MKCYNTVFTLILHAFSSGWSAVVGFNKMYI